MSDAEIIDKNCSTEIENEKKKNGEEKTSN